LEGCRPYLAICSSALTRKSRGHLATATTIDAHNYMFPVYYGIIETKSDEIWTWFMERLHGVIGHPRGLVVHTDACKGLWNSVYAIFPGVEYNECMRHLSVNFLKKFKRQDEVEMNSNLLWKPIHYHKHEVETIPTCYMSWCGCLQVGGLHSKVTLISLL
jgi:transposase-like protein